MKGWLLRFDDADYARAVDRVMDALEGCPFLSDDPRPSRSDSDLEADSA